MFVRWSLLLLALAGLLALAAPRPSTGAGGEERYVVRSGDTLWELAAERFGGDPRKGIWEIQARNDLERGLLVPGTVLYLPATGRDA